MTPAILVVTGASGAGKTAAVNALNGLEMPGVQCFHFDSIRRPDGRDGAAYLRGQADALTLPVIDTSVLTVDRAAGELEALVRELSSPRSEKPE